MDTPQGTSSLLKSLIPRIPPATIRNLHKAPQNPRKRELVYTEMSRLEKNFRTEKNVTESSLKAAQEIKNTSFAAESEKRTRRKKIIVVLFIRCSLGVAKDASSSSTGVVSRQEKSRANFRFPTFLEH